MIHEFFIVGSLPFFLLLLAEFILLWVCVSFDSGTWATITMVVVAALLALFGNFNLFSQIRHHPGCLAAFLGLYFAAGLVWSFIKFRLFASDRRRLHDERLEQFLSQNAASQMTPGLNEKWVNRLHGDYDFSDDLRMVSKPDGTGVWLVSPLAKRHKAQIITWASYWPWSLTWALFHDAVKRAWEEIYATLHVWYQKVSDQSFKGTEIAVPPTAKGE